MPSQICVLLPQYHGESGSIADGKLWYHGKNKFEGFFNISLEFESREYSHIFKAIQRSTVVFCKTNTALSSRSNWSVQKSRIAISTLPSCMHQRASLYRVEALYIFVFEWLLYISTQRNCFYKFLYQLNIPIWINFSCVFILQH